jgi:hypothetical protein
LVLMVVWWSFGTRSIPAKQTPAKPVRPPATANAPSPEKYNSRFTTDLDNLRRENQRLREALDHALATSGNGVQAKVNRLRGMFAQLPEQAIPELELATEDDWYAAVNGPLESVEDYRRAMARLRKQAENRFAYKLQPALRAYVDANHEFPEDPMQLKALIGEPIMTRF